MEKCNLRIKPGNFRFKPKKIEISPRTVLLLITLAVFLTSLTIYILSNIHKADRIFFFPDHQSGKTIGESRKTPGVPFDKEKNMDIFVKELLLGPIDMNLDPLFASGTKLEKILYRDKIVYLDLNFMALLPDKKAVHGFDNGIILIEKNIKFNFPYVKKVVLTVLGQEPESGI